MEFFPSTGEGQWASIEEAITAADFCVFIVAGRYGSIVPGMNISWTHREYLEAQQQHKPTITLLHSSIGDLSASKIERKPSNSDALDAFREELEGNDCRYFRNMAELSHGLSLSINALKRRGQIVGWVPAGKMLEIAKNDDFAQSFDLIEIEHILRRSAVNRDRLDTNYRCRRQVCGQSETGVRSVTQSFDRRSDALGFDNTNQPKLALETSLRAGPGRIRLAIPRRKRGASFMQDIVFEPPLMRGESAEITVFAELPSYSFAFRDELLEAQLHSGVDLNEHDSATRRVNFPTRLLVIRVFLPDDIDATPAGATVGTASAVNASATSELILANCYREWSATVNGVDGVYQELRVPNPRINRTYRVCWLLPSITITETSAEGSDI